MSAAVLSLVDMARERHLVADNGEWSDVTVYWFDAPMPLEIREAGSANPALEYFTSDGTPHNPSDEGFIDRPAKTAISFLLKIKEV